jgi:type IV pilus assembly protein PilF
MAGLPTRLAMCAFAGALAACAGGAGTGGSTTELRTASDDTSAQKRAQIRLELAVGYYQDGKYEIALDEVKQALVADPQMANAYGLRAMIYTAMGEIALADQNFQRALSLAPNDPNVASNYGSFLCQQGQPEKGLPYFDASIRHRANQAPERSMINAGTCSIKAKKYDAAEGYLMDALRLNPDQAITNASLARVYYEKRDYNRAGFFINRLTSVAKLDTLSAEVLWLAIRVQRKLNDRAAETALVAQLKRQHPLSPEYAKWARGAFDE